MIDLYTAATPNGRKPAILLEELGLSYQVHPINLKDGEQFKPAFLKLNPNSKIPVIVDREMDITVFESGAILIYLAEKTGKFLPTDLGDRAQTLQWLMFQMAGIGPMFGQLGHFLNSVPEAIPYAMQRYETEVERLCAVLDRHLENREFLAGSYSIADMATIPWIAAYEYLELEIEDYPHLQRWLTLMQERPAVQKGMAIVI